MTKVMNGVHIDEKKQRGFIDPSCPVWPTTEGGLVIGEKLPRDKARPSASRKEAK